MKTISVMRGTVVKVTVTHRGSEQATKKLRQVMRKVRNPSRANKEVSVWLMRWLNENFKSQGGKVGGWKPFKLGGRKLPGGGVDSSAKLLQDTGRLRASFSPFYSRTTAGIGSNLNYSVAHELGLPHKNLPSRRMLPLGSDQAVNAGIIKIYDRHIRRALR